MIRHAHVDGPTRTPGFVSFPRALQPFKGSVFRPRRFAFTIMEMVIVVAVVIILVTIVVPNLSALWNERKLADAKNTISGLLASTRAKAIQTGHERGLFFFVDDDNVQRVVTIEPDPSKVSNPDPDIADTWQILFVITSDRGYALPPPMRVVPRSIIIDEDDDGENSFTAFANDEIGASTLQEGVQDSDPIHAHRNFFSIVYAGDGRLLVDRDVIVVDKDEDDNRVGDITGIPLGDPVTLSTYYHLVDGAGASAKVEQKRFKKPPEIPGIVAIGNVALNFLSVDGLLVYDDSVLAKVKMAEKRKYLKENSLPFYIHRMTGAVVRGPAAGPDETVTP